MEAAAHAHHEHHEMPTSGRALSVVALSATLHCLTGCAIGEVLGMIIGTALGFSDLGTIALAVALAFLFGYSLTSLPLLRAGLALGAVIPIAFASDTLSIAVMEIVDNVIMVVVPGAMEAGVGDVLFWGALSVALVIAGVFAFPVNRWLLARGKGHTAVHETGIHGGPPVKLVGAVAVVAAVFGTTVLLAEAFSDEGDGHGGERAGQSEQAGGHSGSTGAAAEGGARPETVRGLAVSSNGMTLELASNELPQARRSELRFRIVDSDGRPVRDYEVEQEKRMHLIVVRRDMAGFQHLHPKLGSDGTWSTPLTLGEAGSYRVFADFMREGKKETLAADLAVDGPVDWRPLPPPSATAKTATGYEVRLDAAGSQAGRETALSFTVSRGGQTVETEPYLGAGGHLVALREGDLAYLHVHPAEAAGGEGHEAGRGTAVEFETDFPTAGAYRLFLQFKHGGRVHTAAFTRQVNTSAGTSEMGKAPAEQDGGHHGE
jgi:hypothetical protein